MLQTPSPADRVLWLAIRRCLLILVAAIEKVYGKADPVDG